MHRASKTTRLLLGAMTFASTLGAQPTFQTIPQTALLGGSPIHIPLDGRSPSGQALSFTAVSSDPLVTPTVLTGNRSLRIHVTNFGVMVFELFDGRARRATNRIAALATSGFYDGVIFHRIINDFVLQGGDPTGTGTGGSTLGRFDDKFHVDLQHNRTGLLSMAKSGDDTNNSQFFITEGPRRHLDFNHSIFGILVEGEAVRERISNVATGPDDRPITDVVMESVESFTDTQNAVLMLKAPEGATGAVDITVTVRNASGAETQQTFRVNVTPDLVNSAPFLADVEDIETPVNTAVTYQLIARDAEGDPALFLDQTSMTANGLQVPVVANENLQYVVEFETGLMTVTPTNGLSGRHQISIATAVNANAVDYQVVPVVIGPPPEDP